MKLFATTLAAAAITAAPAFAQDLSDEAAYAADEFGQCATCHMVADEDGNTIAGGRARTGPNLYCVVGRQAGTSEDFRYGRHIVEAGEEGLVWDHENLVPYLEDPRAFLRDYLDDKKARSKMTHKVRKDGDKSADEVAAAFAAFLDETCPDE